MGACRILEQMFYVGRARGGRVAGDGGTLLTLQGAHRMWWCGYGTCTTENLHTELRRVWKQESSSETHIESVPGSLGDAMPCRLERSLTARGRVRNPRQEGHEAMGAVQSHSPLLCVE